MFLVINTRRFLNIGLHGATLGTRFLLIFFLAKYLDPASVGYYGLFTATVGYCLYFVGLDFYTFATREILKTPHDKRGQLLKGQAVLSGVLYLLLLPFWLLFLNYSEWPGSLGLWFFPILLLEHFNQEVSRLLVALSEQITASLIIFIRQGSWALALVGLMNWNASTRQLQTVMALWFAAGLSAAALGAWKLMKLQMGGWRKAVDWVWIRRGVTVSAALLFATLALRGIQTLDRYWLEALGGIEVVGAYVLMLGVASTLTVFLDAGIFSFTYPVLIRLYQSQQNDIARIKVRQMLWQAVVLSAAFAVISWIFLPYLLTWIENPIYSDSFSLYPWLLLAMVINSMSMVPHFALYARGCDKPIIYSHIAALIAFVIATWVSSVYLSTLAVPIGLNCAFAVLLTLKTIAYRRLIKSDAAQVPLRTQEIGAEAGPIGSSASAGNWTGSKC